MIDLFMTLDAVDQDLANIAEMPTIERPDLIPNAGMDLGGDLLVLTSLWVDPKFRGNKIGHAILKAILGTVGRATSLVVLPASPVLTDDGPQEGSPEHVAAKAALRRYWADFGFQEAAGDYLALGEMGPPASLLQPLDQTRAAQAPVILCHLLSVPGLSRGNRQAHAFHDPATIRGDRGRPR